MSGIKRSFIAGVTAFMIVLGMSAAASITSVAAESKTGDALTPEEQAEKEYQEALEQSYNLPIQSNQLKGWPAGPSTYGAAGIVMDIESGAILYAKNIDEQHYPASITKLLTTLVALENERLDKRVEITEDCVSFLEWDYAQIGLKVGESISLEEGLYATLLASANEAAYAVAANVGDGYDWFIGEMNRRAEELGAKESHFVNANGLHDDKHYTTARDMALISAALYQYPEAMKIMQTKEYQIPPTNLTSDIRYLRQNHKMLGAGSEQYYEYAVGGKTGYTGEALNTLVTYAEKDNMHLVCVEMKTLSGKICEDTKNMLDYAFDNFKKIPIPDPDPSGEYKSIEGDGYVILPNGLSLSDLQTELLKDSDSTEKGTVTYSYEGQIVGKAQVVLEEKEAGNKTEDVPKPATQTVDEMPESQSQVIPLKAVAALSGSLILLVLIIFLNWFIKRRKSKL